MFGLLKKKKRAGLVGLAFTRSGLGIAHIARSRDRRPRLEQCRFVDAGNDRAVNAVARDAVRGLGLEYATTSAVMAGADYQLLLVEAPDVPSDELRGAVRWRIKDLIDFHIDDAVIDVFEVPGQHSTSAGGRLMYAVAARGSAVTRAAEVTENAGLKLNSVDIPEMCLRNIAALLPEDVDGVALLYLAQDHGFIVLTRQRTLFLARKIEIGYAQLEQAKPAQFGQFAGDIVLELQRSLDYYERHYSQAPITQIALAPTAVPIEGLREHLESSIGGRVSECNLDELIAMATPCDRALQARCLPAIGAALRVEEKSL